MSNEIIEMVFLLALFLYAKFGDLLKRKKKVDGE